jgi:hypothetical protein
VITGVHHHTQLSNAFLIWIPFPLPECVQLTVTSPIVEFMAVLLDIAIFQFSF